MSALNRASHAFADRQLAIGAGLLFAAILVMTLLGWFAPVASILRGWLVAFAIYSCVPIGSMTWLLIHRLTGGNWGYAVAPIQRPAAAMTPLLLACFVPILAGLPHIYPWAGNPASLPADVAHWYLNDASFAIRSLIALFGWSFLAVMFAMGLGSQLLAGLGLAFFGLTISFIAVDWILSLEPHYVATAFAATIAIQQLLAALAVAVLIGAPADDAKVRGDLGGLLIATLLGVVYLEFMTFVVAWYGDLPDKAAWFLQRSSASWIVVLVLMLVIGALVPFGMLLKQNIRRSRDGLRIVSALILVGTILHFFWLIVPAFDDQAAVIAVACAGLVGLMLISFLIKPVLSRSMEIRHAD